MGFAALVSLGALGRVNEVNAAIAPYLVSFVPSFLTYGIAAALPVVLPACLLMGIAYPIGLHLYVGATAGDSARAASRIGTFNSLNLVGAIFGSLIGGFVLLPMLGSRTSLIAVAVVIFASGLALLIYVLKGSVLRIAAAVVLAAGFGVLAVRTVDPFQVFLQVRYPGQTVAWYRGSGRRHCERAWRPARQLHAGARWQSPGQRHRSHAGHASPHRAAWTGAAPRGARRAGGRSGWRRYTWRSCDARRRRTGRGGAVVCRRPCIEVIRAREPQPARAAERPHACGRRAQFSDAEQEEVPTSSRRISSSLFMPVRTTCTRGSTSRRCVPR